MRVAVVVLGVEADHLEKLLHPPLALAAELPPTLWVLSGSETMLPTVMRGFRLA